MPKFSSVAAAYKSYRAAKPRSRAYKIVRYSLLAIVTGYVALLCFPQVLFAHVVSYRNFTVYSPQPVDESVYKVLDRVESTLANSAINDSGLKPRIFLTGNSTFYSSLSLFLDQNSFGKGFAALPTNNVFINKADLARDLVFRNAPAYNQRSLSGVISHEITHLLVRQRFGYVRNLTAPSWKKEGYAEYVAGGSTLPYETGVRMWKQNPKDSAGYQYFKYYMLVKYLLETEKLSVDDLFKRDFNLPELEQKVLQTL